MRSAVVFLACLIGSARAEYDYSNKRAAVGDFYPPAAPALETKHLDHLDLKHGEKLPAPTDKMVLAAIEWAETKNHAIAVAETDAEEQMFIELHQKHGGRQLLQAAGGEAGDTKPDKVPHNWFGTGLFKAPKYAIATGKEECDVCKFMIETKRKKDKNGGSGSVEYRESEAAGAEVAAQYIGLPRGFGCAKDVNKNYEALCFGYSRYLNDCPSFVHNICHEDVGGSERLRSPCPMHLTCYYCLRINPLHCLIDEGDKDKDEEDL